MKTNQVLILVTIILVITTGCVAEIGNINESESEKQGIATGYGHVYTETTSKEAGYLSTKENQTELNEEKSFSVSFVDYDGLELKKETVYEGESAIPPKQPTRDGYYFKKWDTDYREVHADITVKAIYKEILEPTLIVENKECKCGDTVAISVNTINNPGLLGLMLNISYDENVMELKKVINGSIMSDYMFTPPKNTKSGCNAAWSIVDAPEVGDGELVKFVFEIKKDAVSAIYPIDVSCINNAFDNNYNVVSFEVINGTLKID